MTHKAAPTRAASPTKAKTTEGRNVKAPAKNIGRKAAAGAKEPNPLPKGKGGGMGLSGATKGRPKKAV